MQRIDLSKLAKDSGGRFKLASMVSKRMRQLNESGYRPTSSGKLAHTVLDEASKGELTWAPNAAEAAAQKLFGEKADKEPEPCPPEKRSGRKSTR